MAISRLNYSGRKRISRQDVLILLHEPPGSPLSFEAQLKLGGYNLPDDALLFVEAYRQTQWMRFPFGTVNAVVPPVDRRLTEFESEDGILFRVRVTSQAGRQGLLLAEADKVPVRRPEDVEENRLPLFPVQPADLGSQTWRVDFSSDPVLLINKAVGDWRAVAVSPVFRSLVCPAALREVITRILFLEDYPDLEDRDDWKTRWLLFAGSVPGAGEPPADGETDSFEDWIETAVEAFCRQQRFFDHFLAFWKGESKP
jgi:hypothetical protein